MQRGFLIASMHGRGIGQRSGMQHGGAKGQCPGGYCRTAALPGQIKPESSLAIKPRFVFVMLMAHFWVLTSTLAFRGKWAFCGAA